VLLLILTFSSCRRRTSCHEAKSLYSNVAHPARRAHAIFVAIMMVRGATVRALDRRRPPVDGRESMTIDLERVSFIVVQGVLVARHLLRLLQHLLRLKGKRNGIVEDGY